MSRQDKGSSRPGNSRQGRLQFPDRHVPVCGGAAGSSPVAHSPPAGRGGGGGVRRGVWGGFLRFGGRGRPPRGRWGGGWGREKTAPQTGGTTDGRSALQLC